MALLSRPQGRTRTPTESPPDGQSIVSFRHPTWIMSLVEYDMAFVEHDRDVPKGDMRTEKRVCERYLLVSCVNVRSGSFLT